MQLQTNFWNNVGGSASGALLVSVHHDACQPANDLKHGVAV